MARTIPAPDSVRRTVPAPPATGGGSSTGPAVWVDLDLDTSKWLVTGNNGAGEVYNNNWGATNVGTKLVITAGLEDVKAVGNRVEYNGGDGTQTPIWNVGSRANNGFALVYKEHIDCTPSGAPTGVAAGTFYSEYAVITVRLQFGQLGAVGQTDCGFGIGGSEADNGDPWGTSGGKGVGTRCGIGWAFYPTNQGGNPTALPRCDSLNAAVNNYAQVVRIDKHLNQANGKINAEMLTICPNDGATPALRSSAVSNTLNNDYNFANAGSVDLREGASGAGSDDGFDQVFMQMGGFPTVSDANQGGNADSNNDGAITCWLANSTINDLDSLPVNATGPIIDSGVATTNQMRYLGAYAHPWILVDQRANGSYTGSERAQIVIEKISVLVQPIAGRRPFP